MQVGEWQKGHLLCDCRQVLQFPAGSERGAAVRSFYRVHLSTDGLDIRSVGTR